MNDEIRAFGFEEIAHGLTVANIERMMPEPGDGLLQVGGGFRCGTRGSEIKPAHVVIDADDIPALGREQTYTFRANKTAGTRDQCLHFVLKGEGSITARIRTFFRW